MRGRATPLSRRLDGHSISARTPHLTHTLPHLEGRGTATASYSGAALGTGGGNRRVGDGLVGERDRRAGVGSVRRCATKQARSGCDGGPCLECSGVSERVERFIFVFSGLFWFLPVAISRVRATHLEHLLGLGALAWSTWRESPRHLLASGFFISVLDAVRLLLDPPHISARSPHLRSGQAPLGPPSMGRRPYRRASGAASERREILENQEEITRAQ